MSPLFIIQTIAEIAIALFVVWCFINEERLIRFEERLRFIVLHKVRKRRNQKIRLKRYKINDRALYTPERPSNDPLNAA